jgi:hypothetical protein
MNNHKCNVLVKIMVCKDDEVQGISNEPMPLGFVQSTINDNGGQNFDYYLTNMIFMRILTLHLMCKAKISKHII